MTTFLSMALMLAAFGCLLLTARVFYQRELKLIELSEPQTRRPGPKSS